MAVGVPDAAPQAQGGGRPAWQRWTTKDLPAAIRPRFKSHLIPLTCVFLSTCLPWHALEDAERQHLHDYVFPDSDYIMENNDAIFCLVCSCHTNDRVTEWHGKFVSVAMLVLKNHFVTAGKLQAEARRSYIDKLLGTSMAAMKAPFLWREWRENGKKEGRFEGELVMRTLGIVQIPVLMSLPVELRSIR
ncbi:hypothetical protein OH77DRAFT_1432016 [Trametes cingulata]|nr:hypothetical protein OH77DRAFT_1432016 [Trametes cingulata]